MPHLANDPTAADLVSDEPKRGDHTALATAFTVLFVVVFGVAVSPLVGIVHATGFFGGLALWLARPTHATFGVIKVPYLVTLGAYVVHRIDEEVSGFVPAIEDLAGVEAADIASPITVLLVVLSLAWMLGPLLLRTGHPLGHFAAWSMFAGFAIVELWHFVFPLLEAGPYGYFPGMVTAPIISAAGWWGVWVMWRDRRSIR